MEKEKLFNKIRSHLPEPYEKPKFDNLCATTYDNVLKRFIEITEIVGGKAILMDAIDDVNATIKKLYPQAKRIASNIEEINIATVNPDNVSNLQDLNGVDVAIIQGEFAVAENGCIWIPQTMKERAVCFISEHLVILIKKENILNNMHEAYDRITMPDYGYGCFISGPSKTADIAQALVMGAQAARGVTVLIK